jgi:hypothetical protein
MRKRTIPLLAAATVLIGLMTAPAAHASYLVSSILFPHGAVTFYSGFAGPATIRFSFNDYTSAQAGVDQPKTFQLRLREQGGGTLHTQNVSITPSAETSPQDRSFSWPALQTNVQKKYEVAVYDGTTQKKYRAFTLKPYLVKITSISPDPFFPTIDDGFKDTTRIEYHLVANSNPVDLYIKSGGTELRHVHWDNRVAGNYGYTWNGENAANVVQPEGVYTVFIQATDSGQVFDQSQSNVVLDRFFPATGSKVQEGTTFHHRDPTTVLRSGGTCTLARLNTPKDLRINCTNARVRVYWRWTLNELDAAIQTQTFNLVAVPGYTCGAAIGRTGNDTWIQVGAVGQRRCRVDKARITYSFTDES